MTDFYMGKDYVCGHYRTNHKTVKGQKWIGNCKGQIGCAGHEPCRCKKFREVKSHHISNGLGS